MGPMRILASTLAILAFASCESQEKLNVVRGSITVSPTTLSFGSVVVNLDRNVPVLVHNEGQAEAQVEVSGETREFHLYPRSARIGPGETMDFRAVFQPESEGSSRATMVLRLANSGAEHRISLEGIGVGDAIQVPKEVDFGAVVLGKRRAQEIPARNLTDEEIAIETAIREPGFSPEWASTRVDAYEKGLLPITFAPNERREYSVPMQIKGCVGCQWRKVVLRGKGVRRSLDVSLESVDFGYAPPGHYRETTVTLTNTGDVPISLWPISLEGASASEFAARLVDLDGPLAVGTSVALQTTFSPTELGPANANISVRSDDGDLLAEVELTGAGGGPLLEMTPTTLDFGLQPPGRQVTKSVRLENAQRTGVVSIDAVSIEGPDAGAFSVGLDFPVSVGNMPLEIPIRFSAIHGTRFDGSIVFQTDSLDQPTLSLAVTGESVPPSDCNLEVEPESLRWGWVGEYSTNLERSVRIRNAGAEACAMWNWRLTGPGSPYFEASPPSEDVTSLGPGDEIAVPVRPNVFFGGRRTVDQASLQVTFGREGADLSVPLSAYNPGRLAQSWAAHQLLVFEETPVGHASILAFDWLSGSFTVAFSNAVEGFFMNPRGSGQDYFEMVMAPKVVGPQLGQLEVWFAGEPEALLIDLEGIGTPPCEDCGWPDATCPSSFSLEPGEVVNFSGGNGENKCNWGVLGPGGIVHGKRSGPGLSKGPQREYYLADSSMPRDPLGCDMVFHAAAVGDFVIENLEVRADGRAGLCQTTFGVSPPDGLFVELLPTGESVGSVGLKLLSGLGEPADSSDSWYDKDYTCWGMRSDQWSTVYTGGGCGWARLGLEPDPIFTTFVPRGSPPLAFWAIHPSPSLSHSYHIGALVYGGSPYPWPARARVYCGSALAWEGQTEFDSYNVHVLGEVRFSSPSSCTFVPDLVTNVGDWYPP